LVGRLRLSAVGSEFVIDAAFRLLILGVLIHATWHNLAWLGITPRQNSSGRKERLGHTSKRGDKYIRSLLIAGAVAVLRHARNRPTRDGEWVRAILVRKPTKVAAVALANKTARIVWAGMMRGDGYRAKQGLRRLA
jgi:transposase